MVVEIDGGPLVVEETGGPLVVERTGAPLVVKGDLIVEIYGSLFAGQNG